LNVHKCERCGWGILYSGSVYPGGNCPSCGAEHIITCYPPTTQKALGLRVLKQAMSGSSLVNTLQIHWLFKVGADKWQETFPKDIVLETEKWFARPCPPSPEHGFVESRVVKSMEELEALRLETLAANADSEIMIVPLVNAKRNAVWVPALLTVGPGHDGATAGKSTVSLPLAGKSGLTHDTLTAAKIDPETQDPYIEAVYNDHWTLTQLRAGPKVPVGAAPDYVPEPTTVVDVIKTSGEDLLAWAKIVKSLKGKSGSVVWHPGGSITDHFSVHCRENGVPILTTFEPVIGQVLEPSPVPPLDPEAILAGLAVGDALNMHKAWGGSKGWICLALIALHNSAVLRGPDSFWIGLGAAAVMKLGSAALRGEARHAHSLPGGMKGRPDAYKFYGSKSLSVHRAGLSRVTQILTYGFGDPEGHHAYGGKNWGLCGAGLIPLFNATRKLAQDRSVEAASEVILALNIAINQAHNGGWWLNKFIDAAAYTAIPQGKIDYIIQAANAIWEGSEARSGVDTERFIKKASSWPETSIKPLAWRKASIDIGPGTFVLNLKAATVPIPKQIVIPVSATTMKSLIGQAGKVEITPGEINLLMPDGQRVFLWKETALEIKAREK
jgi:hypothetical protein